MTLNNETGNVKKNSAFFLYSFYTSINIISLSLLYLFYVWFTHIIAIIFRVAYFKLSFVTYFFRVNSLIKIYISLHGRKFYINISSYFIVRKTQCFRFPAMYIHMIYATRVSIPLRFRSRGCIYRQFYARFDRVGSS